MSIRWPGILSDPSIAGGAHSFYDLLHTPMALVYSVCTDPASHDLFLVPLASVTPFVADSSALNKTMTKEQAKELNKSHEVHFHSKYGTVKRGLYKILAEKGILSQDGETQEW